MTKDVIVSIAGLQYEIGEEEAVEIISRGEYYYRNNKHYVRYEELTEEDGFPCKLTNCTLKISNDKIDLMKKGASNVHMVFERGKSNLTYYNTPFGDLMLGIHTKTIDIKEEDSLIEVVLTYGLDINYGHVSDCTLNIKIQPNPTKD
ncbi:DUF1934 domain-containing protein [Clostridium sp. Marseille-P299]|uniref:DUF1934 domain-containing protein n=1 Tax=Clostridium sp. Marseille-P299 TaxID=1805477 RepID=UPI000832D424|nr:DUF1934 domain-containing protein [Clostridium sp. Marseille-P299]